RLPLLLHQQDPALYADDPFVHAFATFNPHAGYLALLDGTSRVVGLSAALALLYALTFALTCVGIDRMARLVWPERGGRVGVLAVALIVTAKAGNIGTNHLFESMLLDRLIALALGWIALAETLARPERACWTAPILIALASWVHPSLGLQLGLFLAASWIVWALLPGLTRVKPRTTLLALFTLGLAVLPTLVFAGRQGDLLLKGLPLNEMRMLSVFVQGPQHMVPHLWRGSQWLAWGCYPVLAWLACRGRTRIELEPVLPRVRLTLALIVLLAALAMAWIAVEVVGDLRCTLFQPFRMATVARGIALVFLSDHVRRLWESKGWTGRARAVLLVVALIGDWTLVVVTLSALAIVLFRVDATRWTIRVWSATLGLGLVFLSRHDTESGHLRLLGALGVLGVVHLLPARVWSVRPWTNGRAIRVAALAWVVPLAALMAGFVPVGQGGQFGWIIERLVERCRFAETPTDDVERLALWCRFHTSESSRFIGPPGPKTFRLWSLRPLAFNRAASPYHAEGLADWASRFRDHVGFEGSTAAFARAYLDDRQGLERRYQDHDPAALAALARRQGATHIMASAPLAKGSATGPLTLLHVEGRYAVYRSGPEPTTIAAKPGGNLGTNGRLRR
ncbi:MAG: DUF6798 domain-containing protein, partial [Isosphaeraceae bacterium]